MSVIIRTRKNGQRYPITPKSSFASQRPNFSPTQIWQKFLQSQSPEDRLRLKRAAVSIANRAQSQGNTEIAAEYRKIVNKMTESETTKYDLSSTYSTVHLQDAGKIGQTKVWASPNVTQKEKIYVTSAFRRLPPSVQSQVKKIEIINEDGADIMIGGKLYSKAGAHWSRSDGTIRIFTKNNMSTKDVKKQDGLIAHEGAHALFDKIYDKASAEKLVNIPNADKIANRVRIARMKHRDEINAKYEPESKRLWAEYDKLADEAWKLTHDPHATTEQFEAHNKKRALIDKQMRIHSRKHAAELAQMNKMYDSDKVLDNLVRHKRPTLSMMLDFQDATRKEGGLTNYSDAYVKSNEKSQYTENFAEAMRIWYSADYDSNEAATKAADFPKTYAAFQKLIASDTAGHAVSLTDRPIEVPA